jgi:prepilin-type processing-associated H-X9-DG protein
MSHNPYKSPETLESLKPPAAGRGWGVWLVYLVMMAVALVALLALLLLAVRVSREPARRMQCANNLKQIVVALRSYADEYGCLPPAYTVDPDGKPLHSWRALILPYAGQKLLYDKIDLSQPWDDPANRPAYESNPYFYQCPSAANLPKGHTTYLAVVAPGGCFQPTKPRTLAEITDDHGLTLMVIEVPSQQAVHWMSPLDASEELVLSAAAADKPAHPLGTQAAFVDGHVDFLSARTKPETLRSLISIAGSDDEKIQD